MVNGKVSTTYRYYMYTYHLYIDGLSSILSICRSSIDRERPIINMAKCRLSVTGEVSTDISVKNCLPIYRSTLDRHIDRHIDRYVGRVSADILVEYRPRETYSKHNPKHTLSTLVEQNPSSVKGSCGWVDCDYNFDRITDHKQRYLVQNCKY